MSNGKKKILRRVQAGSRGADARAGSDDPGCAVDLGINVHMLGKWRKAIEQHGDKAFPGQGHARDEEMMQLRRENARLRKERDFLKEAAAFFAKEQT